MRLAFMGTPDFAVPALRALHEAGHEIVAVYSQQPRPAGRGQAVRASPVHREAERLGLMVRTPARLKRDETAHAEFAALSLDAAVVAAYGLILPAAMLTAPVRGCLNIHASLLPRWRGAAPIQASILAGDSETGITIMQMDEGLDTGPMLRRGVVPIDAGTTASGLHDALATMGARLILETLEHDDTPVPQPAEGTSYAPRLTRTDGRIDWRRDAASIDRQVRAMTPWPGAFTTLDDVVLKIEAATPMTAHPHGDNIPGTVLDNHLTIACGSGAMRIDRLQAPGRSVLDTAAFLRGRRMPPGTVLQ